jgi:hypothetical protein
MNTQKCEGCGWEYPATYTKYRCRWCGTVLKYRLCADCGEFKPMYNRSICRQCYYARRDAIGPYRNTYKDSPQYIYTLKQYEEWLALISQIKTVHPLTEAQWLEACRYFGKCALCNNETIDTRGFFIPFKAGGRYANWNILPICEECANDMKISQNPFRTYNGKVQHRFSQFTKPGKRNNWTDDNINKAVAFLRPRLEEAVKYGQT